MLRLCRNNLIYLLTRLVDMAHEYSSSCLGQWPSVLLQRRRMRARIDSLHAARAIYNSLSDWMRGFTGTLLTGIKCRRTRDSLPIVGGGAPGKCASSSKEKTVLYICNTPHVTTIPFTVPFTVLVHGLVGMGYRLGLCQAIKCKCMM